MVLGQLDLCMQKCERRFLSYTTINSQGTKDLNLWPDTTKSPQGDVGEKPEKHWNKQRRHEKDLRSTVNKSNHTQMGSHQAKNHLHSKRNAQQVKGQPTDWEKYLQVTDLIEG